MTPWWKLNASRSGEIAAARPTWDALTAQPFFFVEPSGAV